MMTFQPQNESSLIKNLEGLSQKTQNLTKTLKRN